MNASSLSTLAISILPIIFAITLHEAAHGYVARYFGDPTAWKMGRISLNPIRHIDLMGTILIPAISLLIGGFLFGWAKPVPVNFGKLRQPKRDMLWVALAGPGANLVMALIWAMLAKLGLAFGDYAYGQALATMADYGIQVNAMLMVLNLLPLPPLDGGRVVVSLLPAKAAFRFAQIERFGIWILLALVLTRALNFILFPPLILLLGLIYAAFGIAPVAS